MEKILGHALEFKSEIQLIIRITQTEVKLAFHITIYQMQVLGDKNPGANSYMFNFLKKF